MKRILAAILFMMTAATFASGQCSDADRQKLEALDQALGSKPKRRPRVSQNAYTDEFRALRPGGEMLTKAQTIDNAVRTSERNKANPQAVPINRYDFYDITGTPNTATISHRAVTTRELGGKKRTNYSRALHFLEKRGGNWVMVSTADYPLGDGAQLIYMQREWTDASKNKDWAWFERNFDDDFAYVNADTGTRQTKAEAIAGFKSGKAAYDSMELSDLNSLVEGDMAVVTGILHLKGRDEKGQPLDYSFRLTDTGVKRDGRWQLLTSQGTRIKQ